MIEFGGEMYQIGAQNVIKTQSDRQIWRIF